ncbi:hypothetical protein EQH57_0019 [Dictyocoela roeselum]|nr:hypothetical protein EQH57_0019 [Dictyocoela roeselum]
MKVDDEKLFILDNEIYKIFIGSWEDISAKIIIYNFHNPSHLSADKLFERISREYIGIKMKAIRDYVKKCESCNMSGTFRKKRKLTYVASKKIHEQLFMEIIDLKNIRK